MYTSLQLGQFCRSRKNDNEFLKKFGLLSYIRGCAMLFSAFRSLNFELELTPTVLHVFSLPNKNSYRERTLPMVSVKLVFLLDVSIRSKKSFKLQKHRYCDVRLSTFNDVCRHHNQLSATSNINYDELRHRTEKRFSLSFFMLNIIL